MKKRLIGMLSLVLWLPSLVAAADTTLVQDYFRQLQSLEGDFVQTVFDADAELIQASSGKVYMAKPGRFRWDYQEPFEQLIVADGDRLWLYDKDLEQVTVRPMAEVLSTTPLAVLSGAAPIDETFSISEPVTHGGLAWYELLPTVPDAEFTTLWVGFNESGELRTLELVDTFGQRTRLSFDDLDPNASVDPALFRFEPPEGVDVVGDAS